MYEYDILHEKLYKVYIDARDRWAIFLFIKNNL